MRYYFMLLLLIIAGKGIVSGQTFSEILCRPTDVSVSISILFDQTCDVYWEFGITSGVYQSSTPTLTAIQDSVVVGIFPGLESDTKYFYRTRYRATGSSTFLSGPEHFFHTQRHVGSSFSFAVEADPHMDTNSIPAAYSLTLQNILSQNPDFLFDLGDNFMSEKQPSVTQTIITNRHLLYRPYFGSVCHSVPLFLVIGNHEGENGWLLDGTSTSLPVMAARTRKLYYPNPVPDLFYGGNSISEEFVGLRQNYYSWEWGNALFIVIDPYWYTTVKPGWGWTLGDDQYNWFKNVISTSQAKFKFVFCHQLVGGDGNDARGGSEFVDFFEMGGKNVDSTWGFSANRSGWEKPIHQLMVENHAAIYFHGHDHCFAKQDKDGIVYQEVPQPSSRNITNITGIQYGYVNGILMPSRGFILVTVTDSVARVDYIRTYLPNEETASNRNGDIAYSYILKPSYLSAGEHSDLANLNALEQNFPNPFTAETTIRYHLSDAGLVRIRIFDLLGREKATLVNRYQGKGRHEVSLNMRAYNLPSGIYYYQMSCGYYEGSRKMICIN
jgi:hypothetical protein